MSINFFKNIKDAIANLDPREIREQAERPVRVGLFANTEKAFQQMEAYFTPAGVSANRRSELAGVIQRAGLTRGQSPPFDVEIYAPGMAVPEHGFAFQLDRPECAVSEILKRRPELALGLARRVYPFREVVARQAVRKISKENALFSLATALPDIVPFLTLPWAVGEFATDTAFLTANQVRLAFLLAAASDRPVGYREQKTEIGSILLGAFGWRALARELVGKIPFGGGLIPKAAVAYAGTRVAGMSLERYYRLGYGYTRQERQAAYGQAFERGKSLAGSVLDSFRKRQLAKG
jgi:hypothetical protein